MFIESKSLSCYSEVISEFGIILFLTKEWYEVSKLKRVQTWWKYKQNWNKIDDAFHSARHKNIQLVELQGTRQTITKTSSDWLTAKVIFRDNNYELYKVYQENWTNLVTRVSLQDQISLNKLVTRWYRDTTVQENHISSPPPTPLRLINFLTVNQSLNIWLGNISCKVYKYG